MYFVLLLALKQCLGRGGGIHGIRSILPRLLSDTYGLRSRRIVVDLKRSGRKKYYAELRTFATVIGIT